MKAQLTGQFSPDVQWWKRLSLMLVVGTLLYNLVEAGVAIWSGYRAGSIALIGFGLDAVIEAVAASALLWRLWRGLGDTTDQRLAILDRRVHQVVGGTFLALAVYIVGQSSWQLWTQAVPEESIIGLALAVASTLIMPLIAWGKIRAAREIGSRALEAEAKETLACAWLSVALLVGLAANAALGWWWADPMAALAMVPWIVSEGLEGLRASHGE